MSGTLDYVKQDLRHLAVNLNLNLITPLIFYSLVGFQYYGWTHLGFIILYSVWIYTMDDAIENRKAPRYLFPLVLISFILQPVLTLIVIAGEILINLKAIFRRDSFILEQFEGPGNTLIYVAPYLLPLGMYDWKLWLAITAFVTYINAAGHKICHKETSRPRLSLVWGLSLAAVVGIMYGRWTDPLTWIYFILSVSLLPMIFIRESDYLYRKMIGYNLIWQSIMGPLGFIYLIKVVLGW